MFAVPRRTKLIWAQIKSNEDVQLRGDPLLTCFSKLGLSTLGCSKAKFHELGIIFQFLEANDKICNIISKVFQVLSFLTYLDRFCDLQHIFAKFHTMQHMFTMSSRFDQVLSIVNYLIFTERLRNNVELDMNECRAEFIRILGNHRVHSQNVLGDFKYFGFQWTEITPLSTST